MKDALRKLFKNRTARILAVAAAALLLLLLCRAVFGAAKEQDASVAQTAAEARLSAILSQIDGAGTVRAAIAEEGGKPVSAVVFFYGPDGVLIRLRLTQAAAAALNIAENRVLVCPAEK